MLVKQENDESLKNYIDRFNKDTVRMENYTNTVVVIVIMVGLFLERFHYLLTKNTPRTFTKLLLIAQNYSNVDELTNTKRSIDPK